MDILPRDLQLKVIKHFDIDTRLRLGILPCKLQIHPKVTSVLETIHRFLDGYVVLGTVNEAWYILTSRREVITKTLSYYSEDFVTFHLLG